ncbi:putative uncharacterized protein [Dialister sp. CAG:588]|jgi:hypothetical protein|nr:putative uncharacterized protein [Dialister sp. CAG:588]
MKVLICKNNGRVFPYLESIGIVAGFVIVEVDDTQGKKAIEKGLIFKNGKFIKPEEDKKELLQNLDLEYGGKIKDIETEMARTLAIGDEDLLDELKEEREELVNEYKEKRGELTNG